MTSIADSGPRDTPSSAFVAQNAVRRANLARIVENIVVHRSRSRAELAVDTGMNKTTVSSLVNELLDMRLVREAGREQRRQAGRPSTRLVLDGNWIGLMGLEIDVYHMGVYATNLQGDPLHREFRVVDNRNRPIADCFDELADMATDARDELARAGVTLADITVALPGFVDEARGELLHAAYLGWRNVPVVKLLRERIDDPDVGIRVGNDTNLAAYAEMHDGHGQDGGPRDFIYVGCPKGLGSGIVVDGDVLGGVAGFVGEIGHITVDPHGPQCKCGNQGCLERLAGPDALLDRAGITPYGMLSASPRDSLAELVRRAEDADSTVLEALADMRAWLSIGLASAINIFHPQSVVLSGYLAPLSPWISGDLETDLADRVYGSRWRSCEVLTSSLGELIASRGASARSRQAILRDPSRVKELASRSQATPASSAPTH